MKRIIGTLLLVAVMLVPMLSAGIANAQDVAYTTDWTSAITYQNLSGSEATVDFNFYDGPSDTSPFTVQRTLAGNASASEFIGTLEGLDSGFEGSVVMTANQPVIATMVQIAVGTTIVNRPLANGFTQGANTILIASVLKNRFNQSTKFAVQNASSDSVSGTVNYVVAPGGPGTSASESFSLQPGAVQYFDAGANAALGDEFNGSATITADGPIVAAALELGTSGLPNYANSFESVQQGASTIFMPSALCNAFGDLQQTFYAVQNTSDSATAQVTATYADGGTEGPVSIEPGAKYSFFGCTAGQGTGDAVNSDGYNGSAVLTSEGADIVAIGKVSSSSGSGITSSFLGETQGTSSISLPYIRWATDANFAAGNNRGQRAFIAIQNVGSSTASGVSVQYVDPAGATLATHDLADIAPSAKANSFPGGTGDFGPGLDEFGYAADGTFGGGAVITAPAGTELVAVVRIASTDVPRGSFLVGEDYNGIPSE